MVETPPDIQLPDLGEVINQRYRIDSKLGKGGMGQVYCAYDLQDQRNVALKYLSVPKDKPSAVDRFKSEFAKLAQFPHPNISGVYDFGHDDVHDMYFFASEVIHGSSFFEGTRGLSPLEVEDLIVQTLRALGYLHNHHLVHYDIKPGNVLITQNAQGKHVAKVIDFGVADYGFQGRLVGTPSYMAPEMTRREIPDQRADLYSLGVMWYQSLAGLPDSPFRGQNRDETFYNQQMRMLPPLHQIHSEIPAATDQIIERLLSKKPEDRFPYAAAVIVEINLSKTRPMERYEIETRETRQSYIPSNARFVGREEAMAQVRSMLLAPSATPLWITGDKDVGKTRLLGEMRHIAQLNGFEVIGASADDPSTWDTLRSAIAHAIDHPKETTFLWVDGAESTPLKEDLARLETFLTTAHSMSSGDIHICLAYTARALPSDVVPQRVQHIALKPFTDIELTEYIRAVTGFDIPPEGFVEEMMRYTEGNPYFVTELMRALIDQNILFDSAGRWKATTFEDLGVDFSAIRIPGSLADTLSLEFNQLSTPEQQLLSLLAVWNAPALPLQLEHVLGRHIDVGAPIKLLKKGWIDMDLSTSSMAIPNPNRRMAIEALVTPEQKAQWHIAIATLLEHDGTAEPELVHWHFAHSHHPKRSLDSQWALAEHYIATHRPLAAISIIQTLILRADIPGETLVRAKLTLAETYCGIRQFDEAIGILEALERDFKTDARICEEMAITLIKQGRYNDAEFACMRGLQLLQQHPASPALRIRIENYLGQVFLSRGAVDRAIATFERTRDEAQSLPIQERIEIANNSLCNALFQKADYNAVIRESDRELAFNEETGKIRQYLLTNLVLANAYRNLKQNQKARTCYLKGIEMARASHDTEHLFYHYHSLASLCCDMGQNEEALQQYERALDLATRLGDPMQLIATKVNVAVLNVKLGHLDVAERDFRAIVDFMRLHPPVNDLMQIYACRAYLELGDMYEKQSRFDEARESLDASERYVRRYANCAPLLFSIQLTRAEMHRDMGDKTGAREVIATLRKATLSPEEAHQLDITETTMEESEA